MTRVFQFVLITGLILQTTTLYSAESTLINRNLQGAISGPASNSNISADGNTIVFASSQSDLSDPPIVQAVTNQQVFAYNRITGQIDLVSVGAAGVPGDGRSHSPRVSNDGRFVAFSSRAGNLAGLDLNGLTAAYVKDRATGIVTQVSRTMSGAAMTSSSFVMDISGNGRYVLYSSANANIVPDDTNDLGDIFVFDRVTETTTRVNVDSGGNQANHESFAESDLVASISSDGRYVAFRSTATNLVTNDTNDRADIFRRDLVSGETVSVSSRLTQVGQPGGIGVIVKEWANNVSFNSSISDSGRYIAFDTFASNLTEESIVSRQVVVKDMDSPFAPLTLVSRSTSGSGGNLESFGTTMSRDGRSVMFTSSSSNLVDDDTNGTYDYFFYDRVTGDVERVSVANDNEQGGADGGPHALGLLGRQVADGGRFLTFESPLNELVSDDFNGNRDVFLRDRGDACDLNAPGATLILQPGQWNLASLPCNPPPSRNTVQDILADDIAGAYGVTWALFTYDPTLPVPDYVSGSLETVLKSGQGFWIQHINASPVTLDMPAGSRQVTGRRTPPDNACVSDDGCFEVSLSGAPNTTFLWNLIGNPFLDTNPVAFNDLRVTTLLGACAALDGCTMAEANPANANILNDSFFHYNGTAYVERSAGDVLSAWEGYWVPELPNAEFNSPMIRFPR